MRARFFALAIVLFVTGIVLMPVHRMAQATLHTSAPPPAQHNATFFADPATGDLQVTDTITLAPSQEAVFLFSHNLHITSIHANERPATFQQTGNVLRINTPTGQPRTVRMVYRGQFEALKNGGLFDTDWLAHTPDTPATWQITGEVPSPYVWLAPGRLETEHVTETSYRATFANDSSQTFPFLMIGPYTINERHADGIAIRTYFHDELTPLAEVYLDDTARYLAEFTQTIGPYPYASFSIVSADAPVGWGLPAMTYIGRRVLAMPFIRTTSLPHEIAHTWWGNAVKVDYQTGNWAEGLTTYLADYNVAERDGRGDEMRLEWLRNYNAIPESGDMALADFRARSHDRTQVVGYGKTAFVFHMLKRHVGKDAFTRALQNLYTTHKEKTASWQSVRTTFQEATHQDLAWFFKQWVERTGAPDITLRRAVVKDSRIALDIAQTQTDAPYHLSLDVRIRTQHGEHHHAIKINQRTQTVFLPTPAPADTLISVSLDPDFHTFRRLDVRETPPILRDVSLSPDARLVSLDLDGLAHAQRLLERKDMIATPAPSALPDAPLIVTGTPTAIASFVAQHDLPPPPAELDGRGDLRVWVTRPHTHPVLFLEASSQNALDAALPALAHYKRRSWMVFAQGRTIDKGVWPARTKEVPLTRD